MEVFSHGTSLPVENNSFSIDPDLKDAWGLPALRMTYQDHPDDIKLIDWLNARAGELLDATEAVKHWSFPAAVQNVVSIFRHLPHGQRPKIPSSIPVTAPRRKNLHCDGSLVPSRSQPL
jgi:hypothetical protein